MKKLSKCIVRHYKGILIGFIVSTLISIILFLGVKINYSLESYMPSDARSMVALSEMKSDFIEPIPNLRIMLKDVKVPQVLAYKQAIEKIKNVEMVLWMDRLVNPNMPVSIIDHSILDMFYKDKNALLQVAVETDNALVSLNEIKKILPENTAFSGQLVSSASAQESVKSEIATITAFSLPVGLVILLFAVNSWIEPFLILVCIGVAIGLNMGTNIIFGQISFVTQSVSSILQLAVSLDYAIFLLHEYKQQKEKYTDKNEALEKAIKISASSVISSALTTIFGFLVLVFMRYEIGKDLGLVLAKGIIFSLLSVIFFLPALIRLVSKWIEKTSHPSFLPNFKKLSAFIVKYRLVFMAVLIISPIVYIGQAKNNFTYGMGAYQMGSKQQIDQQEIQDTFGKNNQIVLLVPKGNVGYENKLIKEVSQLPLVSSVQSFSNQASIGLPTEVAPKLESSSVLGNTYSRIIINATTSSEGKDAFELVKTIESIGRSYFNDFFMVGESVSLLDMSEMIQVDNTIVTWLAIVSVALVILINFRSISIPLLLVLTIEMSIWMNLSVPYFSGKNLSFIGYLIISSIQLGATVDYAILYTSQYLKLRKQKSKTVALVETGEKVYGSIIPPALILMSAGIILKVVSSINLVSELGEVLGRGAFLSLVLVMTLLPALLFVFDGFIEKTSYQLSFHKGEEYED